MHFVWCTTVYRTYFCIIPDHTTMKTGACVCIQYIVQTDTAISLGLASYSYHRLLSWVLSSVIYQVLLQITSLAPAPYVLHHEHGFIRGLPEIKTVLSGSIIYAQQYK